MVAFVPDSFGQSVLEWQMDVQGCLPLPILLSKVKHVLQNHLQYWRLARCFLPQRKKSHPGRSDLEAVPWLCRNTRVSVFSDCFASSQITRNLHNQDKASPWEGQGEQPMPPKTEGRDHFRSSLGQLQGWSQAWKKTFSRSLQKYIAISLHLEPQSLWNGKSHLFSYPAAGTNAWNGAKYIVSMEKTWGWA